MKHLITKLVRLITLLQKLQTQIIQPLDLLVTRTRLRVSGM